MLTADALPDLVSSGLAPRTQGPPRMGRSLSRQPACVPIYSDVSR